MGHKSLETLRTMLSDAQTKVVVGASYHHYKDADKFYTVTGLSILEATDDVAVKYAMADNPDIEFVRPLDSWQETVEWNGRDTPRFTRVD